MVRAHPAVPPVFHDIHARLSLHAGLSLWVCRCAFARPDGALAHLVRQALQSRWQRAEPRVRDPIGQKKPGHRPAILSRQKETGPPARLSILAALLHFLPRQETVDAPD